MFRSGRLDRRRLNQILARAEKTPHNLRTVAKACMILPQDLLAWFAIGQVPRSQGDPSKAIYVELAWKINELRADVAARNYARIEAAANGGTKTKTVTKPNPLLADHPDAKPIVEVTVEDVLPAAWAIEKIEELANASHWEIAPDAQQAEELHRMMAELTPTPLLPESCGPDVPLLAEPAPEGDQQPEPDHSGEP